MKNIIRLMAGCMLAATLLSACGPSVDSPELTFESAWIRAMPPGMKMTAGFGILKNHDSQSIQLNSFSSPSFGDVSLHRTELVDGMSKMREVKLLEIPAGGMVELAPGGYHLMLMMPTETVETGATVTVQMASADGREFDFELAVERR
jgi:copper(I)-binding protein